MSDLIELYNVVSLKIREINTKIANAENEIARQSSSAVEDTSARIEKLEDQLVKIDEYLLKIRGFQELAKKNLDSQNVLTIEAPPGYRVNLNRLRNWAMMIDPSSDNDPYAQRVYIVAKCDEFFLLQKQEEFKNRIEQLKGDLADGTNDRVDELNGIIKGYREELKQYAMSEEVSRFAEMVRSENTKYRNEVPHAVFKNPEVISSVIAPGAYSASMQFEEEQKIWLKGVMGDFYDVKGGRVLLPVEIRNDSEYIMEITCNPSKRTKLDKGLQNLILTTIQNNPAGSRKIFLLDGVRFNSVALGTLRSLEGTFALEQIPRNPDQLTATLEQIVSSLADTDELLVAHDSVTEYNNETESANRIPLSTLILIGWPNSFTGRDLELTRRIMMNYERYGFSVITVSYNSPDKNSKNPMPEYALQNAIRISMAQNGTTIARADSAPRQFTWYSFNSELDEGYVSSLKKYNIVKNAIGNEYIKRYSLTEIPPYTRVYKKIELPFGIDGKDTVHSLSFENENFATYLVGASRSGKSTLLHTLIAGLIRNYHPDNVELWLADFKQLEFKRYMKHLPPHVKYVLLDESTELVFDLIDKLTAEMMERQKLFSRLGKQRIDQIDTTTLDKPLPVIFVILDEFSIMSQSIAESPIYKLRLQNILAKGAALGIKFLFSSQTFTTGVAGLTSTARAQIQQRIAMKGSKEEISETLELSSNLKTEQVRNWMDALPPHYALVKFRTNADSLPQVKRFLVMYFKDYALRDTMIDQISASMHASEQYNPADRDAYQDKHPVLVDGNSYDKFDDQQFLSYLHEIKERNKRDLVGDEMFVSFGTPRLMTNMKMSALSNETRENVLLISRSAEQQCAASVLVSTLKSYTLQGGDIEVWAYSKNKLYKTYKEIFVETGAKLIEDLDAVCNAILDLKKAIEEKETFNKLIVLIGIDRICMDFDYVGGDSVTKTGSSQPKMETVRNGFINNGAVVSSEEEEKKQQYGQAWLRKRLKLSREAKVAGKSAEEIKAFLHEEEQKFRVEYGMGEIASVQTAKPQVKVDNGNEKSEKKSGAYNAQEDLVYIIKQGSRLGCHFMINLNNFSDVKQSGLKPDYFRYKMSFQISTEDSRNLFNSKIASTLPEHICQFDDSLEKYSFRPYLHKGIGWEGWYVDENGNIVSPYAETDN